MQNRDNNNKGEDDLKFEIHHGGRFRNLNGLIHVQES